MAEEDAYARTKPHTVKNALGNGRTWLLAVVYFTIPVALYGLGFWLPQMIRTVSSGRDFEVGLLTAIPYLVGVVGMVLVGRHSDRTGERRWHVALSALAGGAAFALSAVVSGLGPSLVVLSFALLGVASMLGPFWSLATLMGGGAGAAAGIALVNSIGNIGGFVGPFVLGYLRETTGSFEAGLIFIGVLLAGGGALVLAVRS